MSSKLKINRRNFIKTTVGGLAGLVASQLSGPVLLGQTPIKIGAPDPLTGPYSADGVLFLNGTRMAAEKINKTGGLLGRQVEVIPFDIEDMMPEKLFAAAEQLVGREKVDVAITSCNAAGADVEAFGQYDVPYLHYNASIKCINQVKEDPNKWNVFMTGDHEKPYGTLDYKITSKLPVEFSNNKLAVIAANYEWDKLYIKGYKEAASQEGWEVVMDEIVPYGLKEFGPLLIKIRDFNPSLIAFSAYSADDIVRFFRQWSEKPTDSILSLCYGVSIPEFTEMLGQAGDGVCGTSAAGPLPNQAGREWTKRYEEKFNEKAPKNASAGTCYDEVMAWKAAVEQVGDVKDYKAVCQTLEQFPYTGVTGTLDYNEAHYIETGPSYPQHYFQVQSGELVPLYLHTSPLGDTDFQLPSWLS